MYDSDTASRRCQNLWRRLGSLYEKAAYDAAERGLPQLAMTNARMADVCFWQATGKNDLIKLSDVISGPSS